jgi:colanic acid/amylovoran biosynthesis glycosyltransferase
LRGLRVAFVVNRFPVLSEAFIAYAAAALLEEGAQVTLIPLHQPVEEQPSHACVGVLADHDLAGRIIAPRLATRGAQRALQFGPAAIGYAARYGLGALGAVDRRLVTPFQAEAFRRAGAFDIVHCQFADLAPAVLKLRRIGAVAGRVIVHFRGYDISERVVSGSPGFYDDVFASADRFIANCAHFRHRAIELGCPPDLIDVVPSGIDLSVFPFRRHMIARDRALRVLTVARLTEKKGVADAIEAVARLVREGRAIRYRIIGEGPLRAALEAQIAALGLSETVTLLGAQPHDIVRAELAEADVFLASSVTARSGDQDAPVNTLKEAMASGVPVVATRHGGIPELVEHGETGLLAPESDPGALAAAIARLADSPLEAAAIARAARDVVVQRWSLTYSTQLYAEVYGKALASPSRDRRLKPSQEFVS